MSVPASVVRVCLQESDFKELVSGRIVKFTVLEGGDTIEVCLADIGWKRMYIQLELAVREAGATDL